MFNFLNHFVRLSVAFGATNQRKLRLCSGDGIDDLETLRSKNCSVGNSISIKSTVIHENYTEGNLKYDIGLIKLSDKIQFNCEKNNILYIIC